MIWVQDAVILFSLPVGALLEVSARFESQYQQLFYNLVRSLFTLPNLQWQTTLKWEDNVSDFLRDEVPPARVSISCF